MRICWGRILGTVSESDNEFITCFLTNPDSQKFFHEIIMFHFLEGCKVFFFLSKVTQINHVSRNQLHHTANDCQVLNFGLAGLARGKV